MKTYYLFIAHGSRRQESNNALFELIAKFKNAYPGREVEGCFLDIAKPTIREGIELCVRKGAQEIILLPLMFFEGRHVAEDIPREIEWARSKYPDLMFHYGAAVGDHPLFLALLEDKAQGLKRK